MGLCQACPRSFDAADTSCALDATPFPARLSAAQPLPCLVHAPATPHDAPARARAMATESEFSAPSADEDEEYDDRRARARPAPKKGRKSKAAEPAPDVGALPGILDRWPSALIARVLDHLPLLDLLNVARASKRAKEVVLDPERGHLERAFADIWDYDGEDALPACPEDLSLYEYADLIWPHDCSVRYCSSSDADRPDMH